MDSIYAFKGPGRRMLSLYRNEGRIDLMSYVDGSMGILRDKSVLGMWEHHAQNECLEEFVRLAGGKERFNRAVVFLRQKMASDSNGPDRPSLN